MQGYFRDDQPLCELVLDDAGRKELDGLWDELNFVTRVPTRQYKDFIFFERAEPPRFAGGAEFDFARSEDRDAITEAKMRQLAEAYLAKARKNSASDEAVEAITTYFAEMSAAIRRVEQSRRDAGSRPTFARWRNSPREPVAGPLSEGPSTTGCSPSTGTCAREMAWATRTRFVTQSPMS